MGRMGLYTESTGLVGMRTQRYFSHRMAVGKEEYFRKIYNFEQRP